jgi:CheY-like chemotaxis protein
MILLVEDDADVREMTKEALEHRGYPVVEARNGAEALAVLEHERPCLMILDLVMPVVTGWQVLDAMHARGLAGVPVCVISAFADRAPHEVAGTLRKPFALHDLLGFAERFCAHRSDRAGEVRAAGG